MAGSTAHVQLALQAVDACFVTFNAIRLGDSGGGMTGTMAYSDLNLKWARSSSDNCLRNTSISLVC